MMGAVVVATLGLVCFPPVQAEIRLKSSARLRGARGQDWTHTEAVVLQGGGGHVVNVTKARGKGTLWLVTLVALTPALCDRVAIRAC